MFTFARFAQLIRRSRIFNNADNKAWKGFGQVYLLLTCAGVFYAPDLKPFSITYVVL